MTNKKLQSQIISDLKEDFPEIKEIRTGDNAIIIRADSDTLWEIFEVLYKGLDNVELNMGGKDDAHIVINI